jgi:glycosyltransferase involved in cell wall biosynthesis
MNVLLVHQNFPGQFKHLAPKLIECGHRVVALTMNQPVALEGVEVHSAPPEIGTSSKLEWAQDFETKLLRGEAAFRRARKLRQDGFIPDVIVGHMGWGDMLFLKDVWPTARMGVYCEFFYTHSDSDSDFDPEFPLPGDDLERTIRLKLKTLPQRLHFGMANRGLSPTRFQADTYPADFRKRISVIHDGIDTAAIAPFANPSIQISGGRKFDRSDEVITFVSRHLEPYRGYHIFMRALPRLLKERPEAHVFIIGSTGSGYGQKPPSSSWRDIFLAEVRDHIDLSRVHFTGALPHRVLHELLSISSLHVYLTYPFVLSWSLLEAMALEAPILASDIAPVREVIKSGQNGILTDFFDGDALVERAVEILDSPRAREAIGQSARQTIIDKYDLQTTCLPAQVDWIESLAQEDPLPPFLET